MGASTTGRPLRSRRTPALLACLAITAACTDRAGTSSDSPAGTSPPVTSSGAGTSSPAVSSALPDATDGDPGVGQGPSAPPDDCTVSYRVVDSVAHDPDAFTQGLVVDGGIMYESTGLYGESTVRAVDPGTGEVLGLTGLPTGHFGEGLALAGDRLLQLTWREGVVHVYDRSLAPVGTIPLEGEGWGLTTDGGQLVLSDGTPVLRWVDPTTFATQRAVTVTDDGEPVELLNELELVDGAVLANVWLDRVIVVIDPASGEVTGRLDLSALVPPADELTDPADDVLNGIALDPATGHVYVTGKRWPQLHELELDRACWPTGTAARP
jgi:glutamine cyclotransferase